MPTGVAPHLSTPALSFAIRGLAWSLGLFGVLRLGWFETHALLPLTQLQGRIATAGFGAPALPVEVTLACSGADAFALCAGAILGFPSTWRWRFTGVAAGTAMILFLNTLRIGTLGQVAASPQAFAALHLYVWPALLMLAIAGYVFGWMRVAETHRDTRAADRPASAEGPPYGQLAPLTRRFVMLAAAFLVVFVAVSPWYLQSSSGLVLAESIAGAAAVALSVLGVASTAEGNLLWTARGAFLVTQECIWSPLIPVYLAAAMAYGRTWTRRALALGAAAPLFAALGVARLLVVALPPAIVGSPLLGIHAFYQVLLAGVLVFAAAAWRHGRGAVAWRRALVGGLLGAAFVYLVGPLYTRGLASIFAAGPPLDDPQGALALLPAFQIGLYVALTLTLFAFARWRPIVAGVAVLGLSQVVGFAALHFVSVHAGLAPHVRDVRAWAVAAPLLVVAAMVTHDRSLR